MPLHVLLTKSQIQQAMLWQNIQPLWQSLLWPARAWLSGWLSPFASCAPAHVRLSDTCLFSHVCHCLQIKVMGTRDKAEEADFSTVPLEEEEATVLKEAAMISMGTEISMEDMLNIEALCDQVGHPAQDPVYFCQIGRDRNGVMGSTGQVRVGTSI